MPPRRSSAGGRAIAGSPVANRARPDPPCRRAAAVERRRGRCSRAPTGRVRTRAIVSGRWAVHRTSTATGSADGGIHQPLNPPSTSCGGPRSPSAVDADHDVVEALAEHEPAPVGAAVDGDVAAGAAAAGRPSPSAVRSPRAGRSGAARTRRSTSRPVIAARRRRDPVHAGVEVDRRAVAHASASRASPASAAATVAPDADGDRLAVDGEQVVAAAGVERRRHGRAGADRQLGDRRRQRHRLGVATVDRGPRARWR